MSNIKQIACTTLQYTKRTLRFFGPANVLFFGVVGYALFAQ